MEPIIIAKKISHSFKQKIIIKTIYNDVSFEIYKNERLAFLGPNGAGKNLTIATIRGL